MVTGLIIWLQFGRSRFTGGREPVSMRLRSCSILVSLLVASLTRSYVMAMVRSDAMVVEGISCANEFADGGNVLSD